MNNEEHWFYRCSDRASVVTIDCLPEQALQESQPTLSIHGQCFHGSSIGTADRPAKIKYSLPENQRAPLPKPAPMDRSSNKRSVHEQKSPK